MDLVGPYEIYVGTSAVPSETLQCLNSPYLNPDGTQNNQNSDWPNGVEAWCGIIGDHVHIRRNADAIDPFYTDQVFCTLGIIADISSRMTVNIETLENEILIT